ncbi:MAG: response regulator transcription factor [Cyclobacteriaceae bacterium]
MSIVKILLTDDHVIVRNGIKTLLAEEEELQVIAEASDGLEAIEAVKANEPDLLIMDIRMPNMNGLEATEAIKKTDTKVKILILSMHDEGEYIMRALHLGADGYLLKDSDKGEFLKAIHTVMSGNKYFSGDISNVLVNSLLGGQISSSPSTGESELVHLTRRELEILGLIRDGKSNKEIADVLGKSVRTVETHRFNIMKKLDVSNIAELLRYIDQHPTLKQQLER